MRKVILNCEVNSVLLENLNETTIAAYVADHESKAICVLMKVKAGVWGFKSLTRPDGGVFFESNSFHTSARQAVQAGRNLYAFNTQKELARFILEN